MRWALMIAAAVIASSASAFGAELYCEVTKKLSRTMIYDAAHLQKYKPGLFIRDAGTTVLLSRCSVEFSGDYTCDHYEADFVEHDGRANITKYYYLRSQFDVQVFADKSFVENNGRGTIAFGQCVEK